MAKSSSPDDLVGTARHDDCDISKVLATLLHEARESLDSPMAESTIKLVRQNAVTSGLVLEVQTEGFLPPEPMV